MSALDGTVLRDVVGLVRVHGGASCSWGTRECIRLGGALAAGLVPPLGAVDGSGLRGDVVLVDVLESSNGVSACGMGGKKDMVRGGEDLKDGCMRE